MNHTRAWLAVAILATTLAASPLTAAAQELAPATDPLIIVGWEDNDGGPIYGHASDLQAINQARAQAQLEAEVAAAPNLLAQGTGDCNQ